MKNTKKIYFFAAIALLISISLFSCSSDDTSDIPFPENETSGLIKIQEFTNSNYIVSLYTQSGKLTTGYNEIFLQIKNKTTGEFEKNSSVSWLPVMHMTTKSHSCPYSSVEQVKEKPTLYKGFIIFQMAGNESEFWELSLQLNNSETITDTIQVVNTTQRTVQVFTGTDATRYVLALIPSTPFVGINDISACLYKMQDMNTFIPVDQYTIKLDPRMPGMGNHTSPNNTDLTSYGSGIYKGKVSLTMTGYWKLNLMLLTSENQVLKGEKITDTQEASSLFFEMEF